MKYAILKGLALGSFLLLFALAPLARAQTVPEALLEKSKTVDVVRVIVRLDAPFSPEATLDKDVAAAQQRSLARAQEQLAKSLEGVSYIEALSGLPLTVMEVNASQLEQLSASGLVASVQEDELSEPTLQQSIPLIEADKAFNAGTTGSGFTVAVLDTGVDASNPMLSGKVVSQACYSTTSSANGGSQSLCPGGQASATGGNSGADCSNSISGCGHGTHVAGIAAGNGLSLSGVARGGNIIAIKVFSRFGSAATCSTSPAPCVLSYTSDQIKGLQRVQALAGSFNIASANMSLGGGKFSSPCDTDSRKTIIDQLRALNIATVVASGNNGFSDGIGQPACISSAIAVGSTTKSDALSGFSNSHALVDVLAPGSSITSARNGGGTTVKSGTSMATPHVAGAFVLHRSKHPADSVSTILSKLKAEGKPVTGKGITKSRIDLGYLNVGIILPGKSPLAFGTVLHNGAKYKGYGNWSSVFNPTYTRYEITIAGQSYYYLNYATIVTPAGDTRFCRSSSVSGKLLVYCYDKDGRPSTSRFGFVTYKP